MRSMLYRALLIPGFLNSNPKSTLHVTRIMFMYPFKEKHLWIKKATGLGVSSSFLDSWHGYVFTTMIIEIHRWS